MLLIDMEPFELATVWLSHNRREPSSCVYLKHGPHAYMGNTCELDLTKVSM